MIEEWSYPSEDELVGDILSGNYRASPEEDELKG